jgi:hypothetical protein
VKRLSELAIFGFLPNILYSASARVVELASRLTAVARNALATLYLCHFHLLMASDVDDRANSEKKNRRT